MTPEINLNLLDLFSGIGGFSKGLEEAGFTTVAFCEINPYCQALLAERYPGVPVYEDVRHLTAESLHRDGIAVNAICGGFPCQDISTAGKGAGIEGERSGLWREFFRLIRELRPDVVFVENVSALLSRGLDVVLGDLATIGYDAEWHCIPASALGAHHHRDRVWIMAYPQHKQRSPAERSRGVSGDGREAETVRAESAVETSGRGGLLADTHDVRPPHKRDAAELTETAEPPTGRGGPDVPDTHHEGLQGGLQRGKSEEETPVASAGRGEVLADPDSVRQPGPGQSQQSIFAETLRTGETIGLVAGRLSDIWSVEPHVGRVAHGLPRKLDAAFKAYQSEGPCIKQQVLALAEVDGKAFIGENWVADPQKVCPRADRPTGQGYELCASVCRQNAHAEIDLIKKAGGDLKGADVYIIGHIYACDDCVEALEEANAGAIRFPAIDRKNRLMALGNAVVPQIPELLGRAWLHSQGIKPR